MTRPHHGLSNLDFDPAIAMPGGVCRRLAALCGASLLLLMPFAASAQTPFPGRAWFGGGGEGWFWYQDPPPPPIEEPVSPQPESPPPPPAAVTPVMVAPPPSPPASDEPAVLSAAWFRANLDRYRDAAIDKPTPENVERFLALQHIMMDRASQFRDMFQRVVASQPYLDANTQRPLDSVAASAVNEIAQKASDALLHKLSENVGLVFFFRSDCELCATQVDILQTAQRLYHLTILYVSLDGKPMSGIPIPAWAPNSGQAERMGVKSAPALGMLRPPNQYAVLAQSVLSLPTLGERMLLQARTAGWITDAEYAATRPVKDHPLIEDIGGLAPETIDDSKKFVAYLHSLGGSSP